MKLRRWITRRLVGLAVKYPYPLVLAEDALQAMTKLPDRAQRRLGLRRLPATSTPAAADGTLGVLPDEVSRLIVSARNRLWLEFAVALILRGLLLGLVVVAAAGLFQIITPLPIPLVTFWVAPALLLAWGLVWAIRNRPTEWQSAKFVDRRLGLRQRLSTAMELLTKPSQSPTERLQIDDAIQVVRALDRRRRVPVLLPGQEARLTAGVLTVAIALTVVATVFNFSLLTPSPEHQALLAEARKADEIRREIEERDTASSDQPKSLADTVKEFLDKVTGREGNSETVEQLKNAEDKLVAEVAESYNKEQVFSLLAQAWREASATRQTAEQLSQGNYDEAATEIEELAERLDELSPEALSEMAKGLEEAAKQGQGVDQQLSNTMERASEELKRNQMSQARERLRDLAQQTRQTGEAVAARDQLTDALNDIRESREAMSEMMGAPENSSDQPGEEMPGEMAGSEGGQGLGSDEGDLTGGDPTVAREGDMRSAQSQARASSLMPVGGGLAKEASDPGGENQVIEVEPPRLGRGEQVQTQTPDPNAQPQVGRGGPAAVSPGITGRINAVPDTAAIPWQFKSLIRDYFSQLEARNP